MSFTDKGKSCPVHDFFTSQMCLLTLFAKIKFSRKFPNLQFSFEACHEERADLLALVCGVFCEFVTFPLVSWVRCGT